MSLILSIPTISIANDKAAVIPFLLGNIAKPIGNVVTVAKENGDYLDVLTAMESIKDASRTNPYLIVIGPGKYAITETINVKDYVNILGSGEDATELVMRAPNQPTVFYRYSTSKLSNLTIRNSVPGAQNCYAAGLFLADVDFSNVTLIAEGCSNGNIALYGACDGSTFKNSTFRIRSMGNANSVGLSGCALGAYIPIIDSTISVGADAGEAIGINLYYDTVDLKGSNIDVYSNNQSVGVGFGSIGSPSTSFITGSEISATGSGTSIGVESGGSEMNNTLLIKYSTVSGETNSILGKDDETFTVSHSTLIGSATGADNTSFKSCVFTDNGQGVALPSDCVE